MTFDKLADRVQRVTKGQKAEILHYLYEAQIDFIIKTNCVQKIHDWYVVPDTGDITSVADSAITGNAKFKSSSHGLSVGDWVQTSSTTYHNGLSKVTVVDDDDNFTTDMAFDTAESGLTAYFRYGFMFDLPSDFAVWQAVRWQGAPLDEINEFDWEYFAESDGYTLNSGAVRGFWIEGDKIRLVPAPADTSALSMSYNYFDTTAAPTSPIIPVPYHQYLIEYAIATNFEVLGDARADKHWAKYQAVVDITCLNNALKVLS